MAEQRLNDNEFSLLRLMPTVLRARDFRLYTAGGSSAQSGRLVDLWQNGGAAVLGHTPPSLLRELKNTASRGLYASFPHFLEGRYIKALSRIFPGRHFRLYAAPPPELHTLAAAALWRPFLDSAAPLSVPENAPPVLIPVVPGIQGWRNGLPYGLCVLAIDPTFEKTVSLPPGDFLPPVLLALAARGIYDLIAVAPERAKPAYPRIAQALKNSPANAVQWQRQGLYLTLRHNPSPENWAALFRRFLDSGFLLPPVSTQPVILPGVLSPGEESKLAALLAANA
ncbi:MAG: hypothetical protein LBH20_07555 [Treponema sp.]|jgi:hypothetical protein|nr:hypothetical protein [Treponema sp.]